MSTPKYRTVSLTVFIINISYLIRNNDFSRSLRYFQILHYHRGRLPLNGVIYQYSCFVREIREFFDSRVARTERVQNVCITFVSFGVK